MMIYNKRVDFQDSDHSWEGEGEGFERKVLRGFVLVQN